MTLTVRKPTGLPAWPVLLLAGVEKSGKTYAAAQASASDMIGHTYWIGFGEQDPDEYGQIGRFDIVEHDGTYRDLLRAIDDVKAAVSGDKPTLLVVDSLTPVWELLKNETQEAAWRRAKATRCRPKPCAPSAPSACPTTRCPRATAWAASHCRAMPTAS